MSFENTPSQNDLSDRKESLQARYRLDRENQFASQNSNPSEFKSDQKSENKILPTNIKNSPENTKLQIPNDITSKYQSAQPDNNLIDDQTSSIQQRPVISRFGMSPIRTSEIRSNLTFEDKAQSKHRLLTNTLSKNRNVNSNHKDNSELRSEDRYINLDGVVEIYEDGDEQKDQNVQDNGICNGDDRIIDQYQKIKNDDNKYQDDKDIVDKFNKKESYNDQNNINLNNNISNSNEIRQSSDQKNNEYYSSQKSNQYADYYNLINGDNSSKKDDNSTKNEKKFSINNNSDVKNNIKDNEIEQTFKPDQIRNSLDNKLSNQSLSFDIQNNTLIDTLEIDNFKPSDSRKKFQDCQPLIQDLKKDYAEDNERFDQLLNESIGRQNENNIIKNTDNDYEKSSHRQSDQSNNISRDREKKVSNCNDDLSDVKLTLNNMNVSRSPQNSEDIQKINERIERIEKSVLKKSKDEKDDMSNKLELVYETVKMLQNKLESYKNFNNKDNHELSLSNEQSLLNNLPSFGSNNESNELNNANINENKDKNEKDQLNYKILKCDIIKLENKNKDLVKLMKDQEIIFKKTEDNYKNYINNLLKIQSFNQKYEQIKINTLLKCNDTQNQNKNIQSNNNEVNKTIKDYEIIIKDLKNENQSLKNGGNEIFLRDNSKYIKLEQMYQEAISAKRHLTTENKKLSDELKIFKNKQDKEVNVIKKKVKDYEDELKRFRKI